MSDTLIIVSCIAYWLVLVPVLIGLRQPRIQQQRPSHEKSKRDVSDAPFVPYDLYRDGEICRRVPFNRDIPRSYTVGADGEIEEMGE